MKEPVLEPLLRKMRLGRVLPFIKLYPECHVLDIGCGWNAKLLMTIRPFISKGTGIDFKAPTIHDPKITTIEANLTNTLPFKDSFFDVVTMLAVMEHLEDDLGILEEASRVLKPGGGILITVPSWNAKPILEFLSYRMGIINPSEIRDHKRYYNRKDLTDLVSKVPKLKIESHQYFQCGCNNLLFLKKEKNDG